MFRSSLKCAIALSAAAIVSASQAALAGPLTPPAGPVTATQKPLGEVEPRTAINAVNTPGDAGSVFRITQRGSYYLTGNIAGVGSKACIVIATDGVTIDLGGFSIIGGAEGVQVSAPGNTTRAGITVRNGSISGCSGIGLDTGATDGAVIENIQVSACAGLGISVGSSARVTRCTALHTSYGIWTGANCRISDCEANSNTISGIAAHEGSVIENCTASANTLRGIDTWNNVTVTRCKMSSNTENALDCLDDAVIENCTMSNNGGIGIHAGVDAVVTACTVSRNGGSGIEISSGRVRDCTANNNGAGPQGGGAGIRVTGGTGTRIEGNSVSNCEVGIYSTGYGCCAISNIGHNLNSGFVVLAGGGSSFGTIVYCNGEITGPGSPTANYYQ